MSVEAQYQIRQNATELQDYMKDLMRWEKEMKGKETARTKSKDAKASSRPAVRGKAAGPVGTAPPELQSPAISSSTYSKHSKPVTSTQNGSSNAEGVNAAYHTYDNWKKWDKFDPDADDDTPSKSQPPSASSTSRPTSSAPKQNASTKKAPSALHPVGAPPIRKPPPPPKEPDTADEWKSRGNDLFKAGRFEDAAECYSRSISTEPTAVAYSNRAMAMLKLKKFKDAQQDCSSALALDPANVKAYLRRGAAQRELQQHVEAMEDFERALRYEPTNKTIIADRDACIAQICKQEKLKPPTAWQTIPVKVVKPAPPTQQQTPPREAGATSNGRQPQAPSSSSGQTPSPVIKTISSTPASKPSKQSPRAATHHGSAPSPPATSTSTASRPQLQLPPVAAAAVQHATAKLAKNMKAPATSTEFEAAWRGLKSNPELQLQYISLINPDQLVNIFKSSLTPQLLTALVQTVLKGMGQAQGAGAEAGLSSIRGADQAGEGVEQDWSISLDFGVRFLRCLTGVPRFDMNVMCLPGREKAGLKASWQEVGEKRLGGSELAGEWVSLQKQYKL